MSNCKIQRLLARSLPDRNYRIFRLARVSPFYLAFLLFVHLAVPVYSTADIVRDTLDAASSNDTPNVRIGIRIGVLALRGFKKTRSLWNPTAEYLTKTIPGFRFSILPLNNDTMEQAVKLRQIDFVLSNPANYATLENKYGISRIATLKNKRFGGSYTQFGALIFTRADRSDIKGINDLKNKSFMGAHPQAFGGWWMALHTLIQHDLEPAGDFKRIEFSGLPQDKIVYAVKNRLVDAGTVRTDLLERMHAEGKIDLSEFRVLNPQDTSGDFPFAHSTALYPEWAFATTNSASEKLAQQVTIALLSLSEEHPASVAAKSTGWTVPLDYQPVHELMMALRVGPYIHLGEINLADFIKQYAIWISILALFIISLILALAIAHRLNQKLAQSKSHLEQEVTTRKKAEEAEKIQAERIRMLYEVSAIPGLGFDEQIEATIKLGCRLFHLEIGKVCRIDSESNTNEFIKVVAPDDIEIKSGAILSLPKTLCNLTYDLDKPLAVHNMGKSDLKDHPVHSDAGLESYIGTTIWVEDQKFGTINFSGMDPRVPFKDSDKDLINLIGRWVSVTLERQHAAEETFRSKVIAESANQAKSSFLANMSHELRTPLNAIIGYSEIIEEEAVEKKDEQISRDIERIKSSGHNLLNLINEVLDLSKIEAGKIELDIHEVHITDLFQDLDTTVSMLAQKNNNKFIYEVDKSINSIITDMPRLRQVLINILGNACKFTHNGEIRLTHGHADHGEDWIYFEITDNGPGISADELPQLFREFSQVGSTKNKLMGTGLGLTISKKFCQLLGGDISVESELNKGTTFTVTLPRNGPEQNMGGRISNFS